MKKLLIFLIILSPTLFPRGGDCSLLSHPSQKVMAASIGNILPFLVHLEIERRNAYSNILATRFYPFPFSPSYLSRKLKELPPVSSGTGILIHPDGYILTNAFLVEGAKKIRCFLSDGTFYPAAPVGEDFSMDIAILKIQKDRHFLYFSQTDHPKISKGEWVFVISRYAAKNPAISKGIIVEVPQEVGALYQRFLLTNIPIGLTNSGGPLLNMKGDIIGLTDAFLSKIASIQGVGVSIPWDKATSISRQIIDKGWVIHGWLGMRVQDILFPKGKGYVQKVMAVDVAHGGPAYEAGVKPGDIILEYQKIPVLNSFQLKHLVMTSSVGETVTLKISRKGTLLSLHAILAPKGLPTFPTVERKVLGIVVTSPPPTSHKKGKGLRISWVDPNGPMGQAGFEAEDIIDEINGTSIRSREDLKKFLYEVKPGDSLLFHAIDHRTGRGGYVQIRLP